MPGKGNLTWHPPFLVIFFLFSHINIVIHFYAKSLLFLSFTDKLLHVIRPQRRGVEDLTFIFYIFLYGKIIFGLSVFILWQ